MALFKYDHKAPCPTDRYVLDIYRYFLERSAAILEVWKRGVVSQLMMERGYIDIADARLSLRFNKHGPLPIVSLKPVIGNDAEHELETFAEFFKTYEKLRSLLLSAVKRNIAMRSDAETQRIVILTNLVKLAIASFNVGTFNALDFMSVQSTLLSDDLANNMRLLKVSHVVGPKFQEGGTLYSETDSDLIGAFYRYVRKQQAVMLTLLNTSPD